MHVVLPKQNLLHTYDVIRSVLPPTLFYVPSYVVFVFVLVLVATLRIGTVRVGYQGIPSKIELLFCHQAIGTLLPIHYYYGTHEADGT